ncbi:MAG: type IV pilus assembly protein PilM [Phycisphaerae bacterium]|nr:type IV pilus assembly protein PilM [Phycisphaerae bacterium]
MAAKLPVWGIDVGQCALKAVKLQLTGEQYEILEIAVVEHAQILSQPEADAPSLIKASLEALLARHDVRKEPVVVAVPGQQTLTRFTKLPPVEQKKIPDIVNFEARQQIPFDMDEVVWDYEILSDKQSPDVEVGIFAIRKELIRTHLAHFLSLGIQPIAVQAAPLAAYNALRVDGQLGEETTLLLDIGALATDLIVVEGRSLWSRPVPIGGNHFTEALMQAFKLAFPKAESLKRTAASSKYARQIFQAMRPVFADLVSEIQRSIGFYTSTHRQSEIKRVLGMGNAFGLPGLQKFLQQNLQLRIDRFAGFQKVAPTPAVKSPEYTENALSLSVAFGAAAQGLGGVPIQSSLLPLDVTRQQVWKKKRPYFVATAASLAAAAGAIWLGNTFAARALAAKFGTIERPDPVRVTTVDAAARILEAPPTRGDKPPLQAAAEVLGALEKLRSEYSTLGDVGPLAAKIKTIADLPAANVVVPQIYDTIHRVFESAVPEEVRSARTIEEYLALVKRIPRPERSELWIDQILCKYDRQDASRAFATRVARGGGDSEEQEGRQPGWSIIIYGRTTRPNPAAWLGELCAKLEIDGRKPDRQFWFQRAELRDIQEATGAAISGPRAPARGTPSPVGSRDERDRPSNRRDRDVPAEPPPSRAAAPTGDLPIAQQLKMIEPAKDEDPVTLEKVTGDSTFTITLVVRKGAVPKNLVGRDSQKQPVKDAEGGAPADRSRDRRD